MQIILEGLSTTVQNIADAQEIIKNYEAAAQSEQKIISYYLVDGVEVADINTYLESKSAGEIQNIILIVRTAQELLKETIASFLEYLPLLKEGFGSAKTKLTIGEYISLDDWLPLFDGLDWTSQLLQSLKKLVDSEDLPITDLANGWQGQLEEMLSVWKNEDYVLLADLIEYEILETLGELETNLKEYLDLN
ncbi:MAG: hypothetical protein WDA53_06135 [Bacillota bacterium]